MGSVNGTRRKNEEEQNGYEKIIKIATSVLKDRFSTNEILEMPYKDLIYHLDALEEELKNKQESNSNVANDPTESINDVENGMSKSFSEIWGKNN